MRYHGQYGQVKLDPSGAGGATALVVASLNSWTLDLSRDKVDVTSFGDTNKMSVVGLPGYKGSLGGFYDDEELTIFNVALGDAPAFLELIPAKLNATIFFSGKAFIDANISVTASGSVNLTGAFEAAGSWAMAGGTGVARNPGSGPGVGLDEGLPRAA
jgi:hypothetical protein